MIGAMVTRWRWLPGLSLHWDPDMGITWWETRRLMIVTRRGGRHTLRLMRREHRRSR